MRTILVILAVVSGVQAAFLPVVVDDLNSYADGAIVGQGSWQSYVGDGFVVQGNVTLEGAKALHNYSSGDHVIEKLGSALTDGKQSVWVRTENRSLWGDYNQGRNGNTSVRVMRGSWGGAETRNFIALSLKKDGNASYYDGATDSYRDFATYPDNEWVLLELEWRASDNKARYGINGTVWTDWLPIAGSAIFSNFDTVGIDLVAGGSGGVYFDTLGIPEPASLVLFCIGGLALRRRG